ncbi:MAG TPA: hypothetical protein PK691_04505 [Thermomicrobiales bacterium]|nr:hypothetical protein [Thermomicrobiales bacterium]
MRTVNAKSAPAQDDRDPVQGTWAGRVTWMCPIDGYTVVEESGIDARAKVVTYTNAMYPLPDEPEVLVTEPAPPQQSDANADSEKGE